MIDSERIDLANVGKRLGRQVLSEVGQLVRPETILGWPRRLVAKKFDGSRKRAHVESSPEAEALEELVLQLARDNGRWGYRRIVGALSNLGYQVSHQTVANLLKRHGIKPDRQRGKCTSWRDFIRTHLDILAAVDFFTAEVWTCAGLTTYYVLTCMRVASRQVCIAGITTSPDQRWMEQMARNLSMAEAGFLSGCRYLLHDRDAKFGAAFESILKAVGIQPVKLPPQSPNLNAHLERWHRSVQEECLSKLILFGEHSLRHALSQYASHFHTERTSVAVSHEIGSAQVLDVGIRYVAEGEILGRGSRGYLHQSERQ